VKRLTVKVVPGARHSRVVGMLGEALKVQVAAPAERGKANDAVIDLLAAHFGVKRGQVKIASGHGQARKVVEIEGID
jgi:uncharacterized protein (TIGR00251 family)